jgi:transcription initiation factor TFIIIB Brf1 subunit/transcription initiation factor TFIIB
MSSSVTCGNCGSNEIEFDVSRGDTYCTTCGNVIDQNCIVSEVLFQEGSHGGAHIIGQRHDTESAFKSFRFESIYYSIININNKTKT